MNPEGDVEEPDQDSEKEQDDTVPCLQPQNVLRMPAESLPSNNDEAA